MRPDKQIILSPADARRPAAVPDAVRPIVKWIQNRPMRRAAAKTKPLLRGTLIDLDGWWPFPDFPDWEFREANLAVWCPHCATFHYHGWDTWDDGAVVEHRESDSNDSAESGYYVSVWRQSDPGYSAHIVKPGTIILRERQAAAQQKDLAHAQ